MQERIYSFGAWVRQRRLALRLTQRELAERAACSAVLIAKIEGDARRPSAETAAVLAKALGVSPEQREAFVRAARGISAPDHLPPPDGAAPPVHHAPALPTGNLPVPPDRFVGRVAERAQLTELLTRPDARLVTLTGPGGVGKTRLALEAAHAAQAQYADGAWFVDLARLNNPALLPAALAGTFALTLAPDRDPGDALLVFLKTRRLLLLTDNFEHLLEAAPLLSRLLAAAPQLRVLATSRAPLRLRGEYTIAVEPLLSEDAAALFNARALQAGATIRPDDAPAIDAIMSRLDNLPLAIELAAAQLRLRTPLELEQELAAGALPRLRSGPRDAPARQQTLRAAIGWSVDLLDQPTHAAFMNLGVFAGGCSYEAAVSVLTGDDAAERAIEPWGSCARAPIATAHRAIRCSNWCANMPCTNCTQPRHLRRRANATHTTSLHWPSAPRRNCGITQQRAGSSGLRRKCRICAPPSAGWPAQRATATKKRVRRLRVWRSRSEHSGRRAAMRLRAQHGYGRCWRCMPRRRWYGRGCSKRSPT
jgi:DNA-binding XRE family transcriptional regulator